MEKKRPTYDLDAIKAALGSPRTLAITTTALRTAMALGYDRAGIVQAVTGLDRSMFYKSMTTYATLHLDKPAHERMAAVSQCKAKVSRGAKFVGQNAIQTHGGIGITQELAIGHYFKRATLIEGQFGSADYHYDRFERLVIDEAA